LSQILWKIAKTLGTIEQIYETILTYSMRKSSVLLFFILFFCNFAILAYCEDKTSPSSSSLTNTSDTDLLKTINKLVDQSKEDLKREKSHQKQQNPQDIKKIQEEEQQRAQELEKQKQRQKETNDAYEQALSLYRQKKYVDAKSGFENVEKLFPGYKSTRHYIKTIDRHMEAEHEAVVKKEEAAKKKEALSQKRQEAAKPQPQVPSAQPPAAPTKQPENPEKQAQLTKANEEKVHLQEKKRQADEDYRTAVEFYKERKFKESKDKFEAIHKELPGYKNVETYLKKIDKVIASDQLRQEQEKQRALEKQRRGDESDKRIKEAHQKWVESQRAKEGGKVVPLQAASATASVAPAKPVPVKTTSVPTPPVVTKEQQEQEAKLLADLAERSSRLFKAISDMADDRNTIVTKNKMAKVEQVFNNLKQEKEKTLRQMHEEEERRHAQELKERQFLRKQEAEKSYDEAIDLLGSKDFDGAKRKLLEVENLLPNYKGTRSYLAHIYDDQRRAQEEAIAEKAKEQARRVEEEKARQKLQEERLREARIAQAQEQLTEITQRAGGINDEILKLTANKDYQGAKSKFDELEQAMLDLKKIKETIASEREEQNIAKTQIHEQQKTTQEAMKVLREKNVEANQHKIDQERKEHQRQDAKEAQAFKEKEERNQRNILFRQAIEFYKVKKFREAKLIFEELAAQGDPRAKGYINKLNKMEVKDLRKFKKGADQEQSDYLDRRHYQQRMDQIVISQEQKRQRKLSLELEKQKQALEAERQEERRRIETLKMQEKQRLHVEKERERLEAQRKKEEQQFHFRKVQPASQTLPKPKPQAKPEKMTFSNAAKIEEQKKQEQAEAKENKEKLLAEQEHERLEKSKVEQQIHQQEQKKTELEKSTKERQDKLEMERKAIRQQLEAGVDTMYLDAMKYYKSGQYQDAARRFSDIQDLIPNYKKSASYLKKSQSHLPKTQSSSVKVVPSRPSVTNTQKSTNSPRQDEISKTLDLFDSPK
jgi:TolA-binding protein